MEHYALAANEVPLFRGSVAGNGSADTADLLLTNLYLIFIRKEDASVTAYPVSDIRIYNDTPQITLKNRHVEVFLTTGEITFEFKTWLEANRFLDAAMELLTGKTKLARNAGKVKKALDDVGDAFGVNILEEARNFSMDTVSRIVSETKPSITKLLPGKEKPKSKEKTPKE